MQSSSFRASPLHSLSRDSCNAVNFTGQALGCIHCFRILHFVNFSNQSYLQYFSIFHPFKLLQLQVLARRVLSNVFFTNRSVRGTEHLSGQL